MKKRTLILAAILSLGMVSSMIATTRSSHSEVMTKEADGTYIINTTTLCKDVAIHPFLSISRKEK